MDSIKDQVRCMCVCVCVCVVLCMTSMGGIACVLARVCDPKGCSVHLFVPDELYNMERVELELHICAHIFNPF